MTTTSFGPVYFDATGLAEVSEEAAVALSGIADWIRLSDSGEPLRLSTKPEFVTGLSLANRPATVPGQCPTCGHIDQIMAAQARAGGPGYTIEPAVAPPEESGVVIESTKDGTAPDITPGANKLITRRKFFAEVANAK